MQITIDATDIIIALITVIAGIITTYLIPWLKSKTTATQWTLLNTTVEIAVQAAEQLYKSGQGQEKKAYVVGYLKSKGLTVDDAAIEAAVKAYFGHHDEGVG